MSSCYLGDCASFGIAKSYDGKTQSPGSLALTDFVTGADPYMQQDLGANAPNITAVRITNRPGAGTTFVHESRNLNVYLSANSSWTGAQSVMCGYDIDFLRDGETITLLCPTGYTWVPRYVTVWMNATGNGIARNFLSLSEIAPLYDGEPPMSAHRPQPPAPQQAPPQQTSPQQAPNHQALSRYRRCHAAHASGRRGRGRAHDPRTHTTGPGACT